MSLEELLLGTLTPAEAAEWERALAESPQLRSERDALAAAIGQIALAAAPVAPSPSARSRLLAALEGEHRYAPFVDRLTAMFGLGQARIQELLRSLGSASAWSPGPGPGIGLIHFEPGPTVVAVDAGFVRMSPGTVFPGHVHTGRELALVMEGGYVELETQQVVRAGDWSERQESTSHGFRALEGSDLVFAVLLEGHISIGGKRYGG